MDKVILITGAAAGMGRDIAQQYAGLKAKLSLADIDTKGLEETTQNCMKEVADNVLQTVVDITKDEEVKSLVENTLKKFGRIDILINCAGIIRTSSILDSNLMEVYDKVMAVNLRSIFLLTSLCAPHLIKSKGCIVNIASIVGITTTDSHLVYSVSKAGLDHFNRCVALELASHGVRVNAVLPGIVSSNLYANSGMSEEENQVFLNSVAPTYSPLNHVIETSEITNVVMFLASDKARSITGSSYVIDAGSVLTGLKAIK